MAEIVVVPCYNEAERLDGDRFLEFAGDHPSVRFLFVNDGSTDRTLEVLEWLHARYPDGVDVLDQPRNMGKAEAVRRGLLAALTSRGPNVLESAPAGALEEGRGADKAGAHGHGRHRGLPDYVGFWDADLATPLEEIPRFARILDERADIDMVFGSRVQLLGRSIDRKLYRHYFGRVLATAVATTLGMPIYDSQCGAKLFRATPELRFALARPFFSGWVFDVELLARLKQAYAGAGRDLAAAIYELPLDRWQDVQGSKTKARDAVVALYNLARIQWTYAPHRHARSRR